MKEKVYHLSLQEEFINRISLFVYTKNGDSMRILITGATSGIGYEVGKALIKRHHTLYLGTHTKSQCEELKQKLKRENLEAICLKLDITDDKDLENINMLEIDCLINHASIGISGSLLDTEIDALREVYEVNIFASFRLLQLVYQRMQEKGIKGKIFVTSSLAGMLPFPYLSCYTSSKAAISMIAFTMRKELKVLSPNISISLIEPGAYYTGFNQRMIDKKGKSITKNKKRTTRLQRNLFALIEKRRLDSIVRKIVKEVEKNHPKFKIRAPFSQQLFTKLYLLFFR